MPLTALMVGLLAIAACNVGAFAVALVLPRGAAERAPALRPVV